jgi:hypothetical protein
VTDAAGAVLRSAGPSENCEVNWGTVVVAVAGVVACDGDGSEEGFRLAVEALILLVEWSGWPVDGAVVGVVDLPFQDVFVDW